MNSRERNPNEVGAIYRVPDDFNPGSFGSTVRPALPGACYMPIEHFGDCCYYWVQLEEVRGNDDSRFFQGRKVMQGYSIKEDWKIYSPDDIKPNNSIVRALMTIHVQGSYIVAPRVKTNATT